MKIIKIGSAVLAVGLAASSGAVLAAGNGNSGNNGNNGGGNNSTPVLIGGCSASALTGVTGATCLGLYSGNLNGNANTYSQVNSVLSTNWGVSVSSAVSASNYLQSTGTTIDFTQLLYGQTIVGIHYGNISGNNNVTVFYKFDAGTTGLDKFYTTYSSVSNATLYKTGLAPAVPEPETYAMLMAGLGLVGWVGRRKFKTM